MAAFYSVIPGVLVHGSGHFYAGDARMGARLLGAEAAGGLLISGSVVLTMAGAQTAAGFAVLSGAILFVGSWAYDVIGAPLAVQKYNSALLGKKPVGLQLHIKDGEPRLAVVWRF